MPLLRQLDLLLLAAALPVFLIAGVSMLAYGVVTAVWLVIRGLELVVARRTQGALAAGDRRTALGLTAASSLGRAWLILLAVLIVGLADHDAGLPAALLALGVFSLHFATIVITNFRDDDAREQPQ
jgi:peptidoglycan/LPS O-acetylase OafA/YrhL